MTTKRSRRVWVVCLKDCLEPITVCTCDSRKYAEAIRLTFYDPAKFITVRGTLTLDAPRKRGKR